ncbi:MAG: succinate dehydrogenase cytochrome b558 subunit [Pirellulales bacterium]
MDEPTSFLRRHEFLLRRLHSLSGLIPVGAFMCVHLVVNVSVLGGASIFQSNVDRIHSLGPLLPLVEWTFIFIPILFHALLGVVIIQGGLPNTTSYPTSGNIRYTVQRVTGMIAFVFIALHLAQMHGMAEPLRRFSDTWFAQFDPHAAASSAATTLQRSLAVQIFYAVGILACVYHLANGLWTMGITWGLWVGPVAQRRAGYVCGGFGLLFSVVGLAALAGMLRVDPPEARAIEQRMEQAREALRGEPSQASPHKDPPSPDPTSPSTSN